MKRTWEISDIDGSNKRIVTLAQYRAEVDAAKKKAIRAMTEHERAMVAGGSEKVAGVPVRTEEDVNREARKGTPRSIYRIIAHRTGDSRLGAATAWAKDENGIFECDTHEQAEAQAREWNSRTWSANVFYTVRKVS